MRYAIVGAGPAGVVAAETLRQHDPGGEITLIGDEHSAPYSRMAIPYYLSGGIPEAGTHLRKERGHFEGLRIRYVQDEATAVDSSQRAVALKKSGKVPYDRLLIASGSRPVRPPIPGLEGPGIHPCWTLEDAREIHALARPGSRAVLIGGGFIGSIILNALFHRNVKLTVVEMENRMVPRMMNEAAGKLIQQWCEAQGVEVRTSASVASVGKGKERRYSLAVNRGGAIEADLVIVATGVRPRTDFLAGSGVALGKGQGVAVNEFLQSSVPEIYAAGDVAEGTDFSTGLKNLHPIQPTAVEHGRVAALNMAGQPTGYQGSLNMNVLETVGLVSHSFGLWGGVSGGEHCERLEPANHRYVQLQFQGDRMIGAIAVGEVDNVGLLRGMIQSKLRLGSWKQSLLADPGRFAQAYLGLNRMSRTPALQAG